MDTELVVIWERRMLAAASVAEAIQRDRDGDGDVLPLLDEAAQGAAKANVELRQRIARARRGSVE